METIIKLENIDPVYRILIESAIKAPSGHNTQPWKFRIGDGYIDVLPDVSKRLPVVDYDMRELYVSVGCAVENICIAAGSHGLAADVKITCGDETMVRVTLTKSGDAHHSPLSDSIFVRQCNRSEYNGDILEADTLDQLHNVTVEEGVGRFAYKKGSTLFETIRNYVIKGNNEQLSYPIFKRELKSWIRYNKRHQDATNDGLSYAVFGAPNMPKWIVKPVMNYMLKPSFQNKGDIIKIESSSHFVVFATKHNDVTEWIGLGRSLMRFLLKATELKVSVAFMNQPNEVESLAKNLRCVLGFEMYPTITLRIGHAKSMPYSKRRALESFIVTE